jgi:hypothetical protein
MIIHFVEAAEKGTAVAIVCPIGDVYSSVICAEVGLLKHMNNARIQIRFFILLIFKSGT